MKHAPHTLPQCLPIAGSDSGGGAGIQADLKAFHANGVFGLSVLTSVTAQNTQLKAIFEDFDVAAVKTGMLSSSGIVETICHQWKNLPTAPLLVVDPVMISKSGYRLLQPEAIALVKRELLPLALLITPNRHEAELLSGLELKGHSDLEQMANRILALGPQAVLIKGGHLEGDGFDPTLAVDYFFDQRGHREEFSSPRIETTATHGTGCTYSAAICAWLGQGASLPVAIANAKGYVEQAIRHGLAIGHGHGPTDHFFFLRSTERDGAPPAPPRQIWRP